MRATTFNHIHLARGFLVGLALVGVFAAWSGMSLDKLTLIPCPFRLIKDISCPGCGMTRACVSFAQGEFAAAWNYHPFVFLVVPLALGVSCVPTRLRDAWLTLSAPIRNRLACIGIALVLGLWIFRLIHF